MRPKEYVYLIIMMLYNCKKNNKNTYILVKLFSVVFIYNVGVTCLGSSFKSDILKERSRITNSKILTDLYTSIHGITYLQKSNFGVILTK